MKSSLLKILVSCSIFAAILFSAQAADTFGLKELQAEALNSSVDLKIAYENFRQSKERIKLAHSAMLPTLNYTYIAMAGEDMSGLAIAAMVLPTPSDWFQYKGSKYLATAEEYAYMAARLNILEGVINNYYMIKFREYMIKSRKGERYLLNKMKSDFETRESLGLVERADMVDMKKRALRIKGELITTQALLEEEKKALNIAINRKYYGNDIKLKPVNLDSMDLSLVPSSVSRAVNIAVYNSPELKENEQLATAAKYDTKAAKFRFISFNGVGFDYFSTIKIEKSDERVVALQGKKLKNKIEAQVIFAMQDFKLINKRVANAQKKFKMEREALATAQKLFDAGKTMRIDLVEAKIAYMNVEREVVSLKYERLVKLNHLNRLLTYGIPATL